MENGNSGIPEEHLALILEFLETTRPPGGAFVDLMMNFKLDVVIASGLLQRCRRYIEAIIELDEGDLLDVCDSLARSVYEYAATGIWILENQSHLEEFIRAHRRHFRLLHEWHPNWFVELVEPLEDVVEHEFGTREEAKLRSLDQRLPPALRGGLYFIYRQLSERAHPTFLSAMLPITEDDDGNAVISETRTDWDTHPSEYPLIATLAAHNLAVKLYEALGIENADSKKLRIRILDFLISSIEEVERETAPESDSDDAL